MEYWDVRDENGRITGRPVAKGTPLPPGTYHLAVELWLLDHRGRVLIQQRAPDCEIMPGLWALTTGRVQAGEDGIQGCIREAREELGITLLPDELTLIYRVARRQEGMIWQVFTALKEVPPDALRLQKEEVSQAKWVKIPTLLEMARRGEAVFYPELEEVAVLAARTGDETVKKAIQ